MNEFSRALQVSSSAMHAQATRLRHVSENISNADTPGFRRKSVSFEAEVDPVSNLTLLRVGDVRQDQSDLTTVFDPQHPLADDNGQYKGSNVSLLVEIVDAREARRSYEANLKMFDQVRQMSSSLMSLLRK
ncbi:MAG: flagellar basal body rod protein FlgC [Paracoccaceae bacterium]